MEDLKNEVCRDFS